MYSLFTFTAYLKLDQIHRSNIFFYIYFCRPYSDMSPTSFFHHNFPCPFSLKQINNYMLFLESICLYYLFFTKNQQFQSESLTFFTTFSPHFSPIWHIHISTHMDFIHLFKNQKPL